MNEDTATTATASRGDTTDKVSGSAEASQSGGYVQQYTDGYAYEVPRPFLTLAQAAAYLGKSLRSLERSLVGRWGNKLPAGWVARKVKTNQGDEWRILPPPGFRLRQVSPSTTDGGISEAAEDADSQYDEASYAADLVDLAPPPARPPAAKPAPRRQAQPWRPERHTVDQPTIVIDRSEEVEYLLRELVAVQKNLSEERRLHLDDMRLIAQLQGSMRLLEVNANESQKLKAELEASKSELQQLKADYERLVNQPWWKRMLGLI